MKAPYETMTSFLSRKIEKYFREKRNEDLTIGEIYDKYLQDKISRTKCQKIMNELTNNELNIKKSTLWYSIMVEKYNNRINFSFNENTNNKYAEKFHDNSK